MTTPFPFTSGQTLTAAQMNAITELVINDKTASHTLTAADAGDIVVMNSATATTITVPNSVFTASQVVHIVNKGTASTVVTAGAGTSVSTSGSLTVPANGAGRLLALSASAFIFESSGSTSGLAVVKSKTTFGPASSFFADGVFTSTYTNYMMQVTYTSTDGSEKRIRYRTGGSSNSTSNYNFTSGRVQSSGVLGGLNTSQSYQLVSNGGVTNPSSSTFFIFSPQATANTQITTSSWSNDVGATTYQNTFPAGNFSATTSFDGIEFFTASGTITGHYTIYGIADS
jgi:hypothetical protein